ncbi:STAS domain-containing protein [Micromonospora sp. DT31]|uniref:STAS domain-containing protein n=1 Tax=Micromonospora sp. DT31 TaxID=3393434 RepID=UPI003CF8532B
MTVVPSDHLMMLICDGCGDSVTGAGTTLPDAEVVWTLVFEHDWVGSPFASGPHHCPRCSVRAAIADDGLGIDDLEQVVGPPAARDVDPAEAVRRTLAERSVHGDRELVDLSALEVIDSAGLGLLVRAHQDARRDGRRLCLVSPSRFVLTVLHTMRLDGLFAVVDGRVPVPEFAAGPALRTEQKEPSPW